MGNLVISKNNKQTLSQNQLAFNKLTARIEKLRKEIEKSQLQFEKALVIYSDTIHPLRTKLGEGNREVLEILWPIYKSKKWSAKDQKTFGEVLQNILGEVLHYRPKNTGPDDFLKNIFEELEGISYEAAQKKEEADIKADMQSMFDDLGLDIDIAELDPEDPKLFAEKMAEAHQKLNDKQAEQQQEHQKRQKPKTAKQLEKEKMQLAVEEMKQKNISTIYKQLAKLFHPDLEQDEARRTEKQLLMQELTAAYEAKNLHTLLLLEMKWIHKENDHLGELSEEKLKIYLQILREQAQQLEQEKFAVFQQPRYAILAQEFGYNIASQPILTLEREAADLKNDISHLKRDIKGFKSPDSLKHVKSLLKEWEQNKREEMDELDFMEMMMSNIKKQRW